MKLAITAIALLMVGLSTPAIAKVCGHDVHGAPTAETTDIGDTMQVIHYYSPATLIMDDPSDPRHRAFGVCRGQGVVINGVANWEGARIWKDAAGDAFDCHWKSKPGDQGPEDRETDHGTGVCGGHGTGKFAGRVANITWSPISRPCRPS